MIETRADVDVAGYPAFRESVWVRLIETGHAVSGPILGVRPAPHCNRADQLRLRPREGEVDCLPAARYRAAQLRATASDQTLDQSDNRLHSRVGESPLPSDRHARRITPHLRPTTLTP